MDFGITAEMIYGLFVIFAILSIVFLRGTGSSLFVGHNTAREPYVSPAKLCKALGICFSVITVFLLIAALIWNNRPDWFYYVLWAVIGGNIIAAAIICNKNIIFKK